MTAISKKITGQKPFVYGAIYLALIPIYAVIFWLMPDTSLALNKHDSKFISSLYFSVITITTLGYGDIIPKCIASQMLTASESLLGITFIGLFLNALSHQHEIEVKKHEQERQLKKEEEYAKDRLKAFNKLLYTKIEAYTTYTKIVTTPISRRNSQESIDRLSFNEMKDLFKGTLRVTDNHFTPAIEHYYKSLKDLITSLEDLVKHGYAQPWPEIENMCLEFISASKILDSSDYILNQPNVMYGKEKASEADAEMIKNHEGEVEFLYSHAINPYVALYHQIKIGLQFVTEYRLLVAKIEKH